MIVVLIGVNILLTIVLLVFLFKFIKKINSMNSSVNKKSNDEFERYLAKFEEFKDKDNHWAAMLALRNGFINNLDNVNFFKEYMDYLLSKIE